MVALTHIGPENPCLNAPSFVHCNSDFRYLNDVVLTYKATDKWMLVTELNYARDDAYKANAYGIAQYATYAASDALSVSGRAEVFRDAENFFVAGFPGNLDFVNFERGFRLEKALVTARAPTPYGEFTFGLDFIQKI